MMLFLSLLACGDKEEDSGVIAEDTSVDESNFDCTQDYALCGTLVVPEDFAGTTKNLTLALYSSLPPMGPPDLILAQVQAPEIGVEQPYAIEMHPVTASGAYHLFVSLYMDGGGEWMPESGIDYMVMTDAINFDVSAVDLGELQLVLAE